MIFSRFKTAMDVLLDDRTENPEQLLILVCNTGLEAWALLDPYRDRDCTQFFDDPRNTMVCTISTTDLRALPAAFDFDALEDFMAHHAVNDNPSPRNIPFGNFLSALDAVTKPTPPPE